MKDKTKKILTSIFLNTWLAGLLIAAPIGFGVTGHLLPTILTASFGGAALLGEIATITIVKNKEKKNKTLISKEDEFNVEDYDTEKSFEKEAYNFNENANSKIITDEDDLKNTYNTNHNQLKNDARSTIKIK